MTTLLKQLVRRLEANGRVISQIKHAHHDFEIDHPGKYSHRHR